MSLSSLTLPGWFSAGGPAMVLLAVLSVIALAVLLERITLYLRVRVLSTNLSDRALTTLQKGELGGARTALEQACSPTDRVIAAALSLPPEPATASWQEEVLRQARGQLEPLRNGLRTLEVIGTLAPLIGLLGTVFGMIGAFQALEETGRQVDPAALSGGIWEALLTTAAGLVVAVPVLAAFHGCDRVVEQCRHRMEDRLARLRVLLAANGFAEEGEVAPGPEAHAY